MPIGVLAFDFDPLLRLGDGAVRWETIGVAVAIFAGLAVAGVAVRAADLRADDLLFVVLGIVPGAVVGGRIGYVLLHPAFFAAEPGRILDPGVGSLELTLAVVGGALTGSLVAILLDGRPGPWSRAAIAPMLLALAMGKLGMVLGGSGQGQPTIAEPATAYVGPGPWGSLGPDVPSIPSQAIEAAATLGVLGLVLVVGALGRGRLANGRLFLLGLAAWCVARGGVAATWRDPLVAGPLNAEQVICAVVAVGSILLAGILALVGGRSGEDADDAAAERAKNPPEWPARQGA